MGGGAGHVCGLRHCLRHLLAGLGTGRGGQRGLSPSLHLLRRHATVVVTQDTGQDPVLLLLLGSGRGGQHGLLLSGSLLSPRVFLDATQALLSRTSTSSPMFTVLVM